MENNPDTGKTYVYSYDTAGNILSAKTYAYTTGALGTPLSEDVYAYTDVNWGDKLTSYNGVSFTYDAQGNPLTYYNGENYTFTWQNGRQLASTSKGTTNVAYKYNSDGIRYEKTVNGVVHKYYLNGSTITAETIVNGNDVTYIEYFYDMLGAHSFSLNGTMYFYIKNLQGDVMHIATADNTIVASYTYDAWGNIESVTGTLADTVGTINPIRYRGYYYDNETELYYVSSRYYDAKIARFISADTTDVLNATPMGVTDKNLYAYCDNNPVIRTDYGGDFWLVNIGIGLAARYIGDVIENVMDGKTGIDILKRNSTIGEYVAAGVSTLIPGSGFASALAGNVISEGITTVEKVILEEDININESIKNIAYGTVFDVGFGKVTGKITDFVDSKRPKNYSSYAHDVRLSNPNLTREQISRNMRFAIKFNCALSKTISFASDVGRSLLPY